jgi:hypothetical protein
MRQIKISHQIWAAAIKSAPSGAIYFLHHFGASGVKREAMLD